MWFRKTPLELDDIINLLLQSDTKRVYQRQIPPEYSHILRPLVDQKILKLHHHHSFFRGYNPYFTVTPEGKEKIRKYMANNVLKKYLSEPAHTPSPCQV